MYVTILLVHQVNLFLIPPTGLVLILDAEDLLCRYCDGNRQQRAPLVFPFPSCRTRHQVQTNANIYDSQNFSKILHETSDY